MKLYDVVKDLLEKDPQYRDSDRLLIWRVWELGGFVTNGVILRADFLKAPHMESIRRVRQKIQEQFKALESSPRVIAEKKKKQRKKGNFVYQEEFRENGHWDFSSGIAKWIKD